VSSLSSYFDHDFNTLREQWESTLLKELKLPEIGNKAQKKLVSGQSWPTLSLEASSSVQLPSSEWKKASNTYSYLVESEIERDLKEDLESGVRNFFFYKEVLSNTRWNTIERVIAEFPLKDEVEVFVLGGGYQSQKIKVIDSIISGEAFHDQGGHSIQELGLLAKNLVDNLDNLVNDVYLGVYVDSHFFHNIAKIRAAKLLGMKILKEAGKNNAIKVVALTSFQGWTLFERYSNMLRNETAVASAYIAGADHIQSAGYNTVTELETNNFEAEHIERSRRMARNSAHVLALESMLGLVQDAAFGSYHLENLTEALCEESWKTMQELLKGTDLTAEVTKVREERLKMIKTRKTVLSGTNDYPDVKETLNLKLKSPKVFRISRVFEELRLKMEELTHKPTVYVVVYGDYAALNGRLNFVKNYFELLGLTVKESGHGETDLGKCLSERTEEIIVFCSSDDQYSEMLPYASQVKTKHKFVAGKNEISGFKNLFAGQNVYEVLESIVKDFSGEAK